MIAKRFMDNFQGDIALIFLEHRKFGDYLSVGMKLFSRVGDSRLGRSQYR
jgi:hypothetical protein